ncbi:MAG: alpha amylase [Clostridia bacterium]|nr:alpha amylase [Clostridia bacterium]
MKKKLSTIICALIAALTFVFAAVGFTACDKDDASLNLLDENILDDNYDNYYEIFVYSYNDSDGNGVGDLNGVTEKLGYLRDLGYTGIWLMPIMPSSSYHGYDVTDYYNINPTYGTLDDYDNLVETAHEMGIKVIIDLVVNHTSKDHPWFKAALAYQKGQSGGSAKYSSYYNFSRTQLDHYHNDGGIYYEGQFDSYMPDLNLEEESVRSEIDNIIKFWLERDTDGFRLDGCLYYCGSGSVNAKSVEVCNFIKETAVKYNPKAYIVGEAWDIRSTIVQFYGSGADSFFYFPAAGNGDIAKAVNSKSALEIFRSINNCQTAAGDYIPAPFLSNHDSGSGLLGRIAVKMARDADKIKFAYGLLSLFSGSTFTYYGDEVGMIAKDANNDPDLRVGMLWDNEGTGKTMLPPGASGEAEFLFGSVADQLKDTSSILNYYKLCNNARNAFPALMRGTAERTVLDDSNILLMTKTYKNTALNVDQTLTIVVNLADTAKTVGNISGELAQQICVSGSIKQSGTTLSMPKYSIAILT